MNEIQKCHHQNTLQMERCMWKTCLQIKACVTKARTTIDLFRLLVIEQSNDVLKQVVIAYEIYPHWHNYPKREVLMSCLFTISQGCLIKWIHFYYIPTHKYSTLLLFQTCFFLVLPYFKWLKINLAMDIKIHNNFGFLSLLLPLWIWCIICILGKTVEPLYGGKTSRKRVSDVAELNNDIVNKIIRIIGSDCIQISKYACML